MISHGVNVPLLRALLSFLSLLSLDYIPSTSNALMPCKTVSYESASRKVIDIEFQSEESMNNGQRSCLWAIDPYQIEQPNLNSESSNSFDDESKRETPKGGSVSLKMRTISLPPGVAVWVYGSFQLEDSTFWEQDPLVAFGSGIQYARPNADDPEGIAPSIDPQWINLKNQKIYNGFSVDLIKCQVKSKSSCHDAVVKVWQGSTSNVTVESVGIQNAAFWDPSQTVTSDKGKLFVVLDFRYIATDLPESSKLHVSYEWHIDDASATVYETFMGLMLLAMMGMLIFLLGVAIIRTIKISNYNRVHGVNRAMDRASARRRRDREGGSVNRSGASMKEINNCTIRYTFKSEQLTEIKEALRHVECEGIDCSICLCEILPSSSTSVVVVDEKDEQKETTWDEEMTQKILLLPCSHMFHETCIKNWLNQKKTCPMCKLDIVECHKFTKEKDEENSEGSVEINEDKQLNARSLRYIKSWDRFTKFKKALQLYQHNDVNDMPQGEDG